MRHPRRAGALVLGMCLVVGQVGAASAQGAGPDTAFPGLWSSDQVLVTGGPGWASTRSALPCEATRQVIAASDWSLLDSAQMAAATTLGVEDELLLIGRGPEQALARLRGVDGSCNGSVTMLVERPFLARGTEDVVSTSTTLPLSCIRLPDGQVAVDGLLDIADGWLASLSVSFTPTIGVHALARGALSTAAPRLHRRDVALFRLLEGDGLPDTGELAAGPGFAGSVEVVGLEPLAAHVTLDGLVDRRGRSQDLDAWLDCHARDSAPPRTASTAADAVELHAEVEERVDTKGFPTATSRQTLVLDTRLDQVVPGRYEGHANVTAGGTYKESDLSDLKGTCTGRWTGTQSVDLVGLESDGTLTLSLIAAGAPSVTFTKRCNRDIHDGEASFPWGVSVGSSIELDWPSAQSAPQTQTVRKKIKGFGSQTWQVTLSPTES